MAQSQVTRVLGADGREVRLVRTWRVEVVEGPDAGKAARVERLRSRVGTHATNDLPLSDETVSQEHLELSAEPEGLQVTDLSSTNGTYLSYVGGSVRVGAVTLEEGVRLRLGKTTLVVEPTTEESELPASARTRFGQVLGSSVVMRELYDKLEAVAGADCSVLLEGETGVGKELVAESLHQESGRRAGPFVVVDCAALAGELIESELFGHVRGAFTGATEDRRGILESADGGTVFLDEVGELPTALQVKLLGALERRQVRPVGAQKGRPIDVRVVAATHRELAREVNAGRFRSDLYYRLAVVRLRIPPLRERLEDLPTLAAAFLEDLRGRYGESVPPALSAITLARLAAQPWPGNVRELRNSVERVALRVVEAPDREPTVPGYIELRDRHMADFDRRYLLSMLERTQLNVTAAAHAAGLQRSYFQRLLRKNGISTTALRAR